MEAATGHYLDRITRDVDLDELLADLKAVRKSVSVAVEEEEAATRKREQLELEASALEQLVAYVRAKRNIARQRSNRLEIRIPDEGLGMQVQKQFAAMTRTLSGIRADGTRSTESSPLFDADVDITATSEVLNPAGAPMEARRRPVPKRPLIVQIMREQPERDGWSPPQMRDALARYGVDDETNLVRVTMRRMEQKAQLVRGDDGLYRLGPAARGIAADGSPELGGDGK